MKTCVCPATVSNFFRVASPPPPPLRDLGRLRRRFFPALVLQGMAVSNEGFIAILTSKESQRALKLLITPDDPMSGGLDVEQAETSEARTLLQLIQVSHVGRKGTVMHIVTRHTPSRPCCPASGFRNAKRLS